jgi:hypothetical protein
MQRKTANIKAKQEPSILTHACETGRHWYCFSQKCTCGCHKSFGNKRVPFNYAEAMKHPENVVTRNGITVRELRFEFDCLVGIVHTVNGFEKRDWFIDGRVFVNHKPSPFDLFLEI